MRIFGLFEEIDQMKIINTKFYGLKIIKGVNHYDKRGYFRETFKNDLFKNKKISVHGKLNKRPFVHIKDVTRAYQAIINAPIEKIGGQIFNIGSEDQNFEMGKLAQEIVNYSDINCDIELSDTNDHRSYFASFQKIKKSIGFSAKHTVSEGVVEMYNELDSGRLKDTIKTRTVEWYKKLLSDQTLAKKYLINDTIF